jgi:hypothetical protein
MTSRDGESAWNDVFDALPARWCVGRPSLDPGVLRSDGYRGAWSVTARGPHPGRAKAPQTVTGTGDDETAALRDLDATLRGAKPADGSYLDELRKRLRFAYVEGAEAWTREAIGRTMTDGELGRVIESYRRPGQRED